MLLESHRVDGKSKQTTILNLGQDFDIPKDEWKDFTKHVVAHLRGISLLYFGKSASFNQIVDNTAKRLLEKGYDVDHGKKQKHPLIPEKIIRLDSRLVEGECLALQALELLGLGELFRELEFKPKHIKLAYALITGRMISPGSERHIHYWMCNTSSILELLDLAPPSLSLLYRCCDLLHEHWHQITERLFGETRDLFHAEETTVFYDLTDTFYHESTTGKLLRRRRSKERRRDDSLVTLALTLDAFGFPRSAEILLNNVSEPGTLKSAIEKLNGTGQTVVMDASIATEENTAFLDEQGLYWICVEYTRTLTMPIRPPDVQFENASGTKIKAWHLSDEEGRKRIYMYSENWEVISEHTFQEKRTAYEKALEKLHEGLPKHGHLKDYITAVGKVERLEEKHIGVSHLYDIQVIKKEGNETIAGAIEVTKLPSHEPKIRSVNRYVLRTSHRKWPLATVIRTYWRVSEVEQTLRGMKSDLRLRSIYHSKNQRVEGTLFITILAYHTAHLVRSRLSEYGIQDSWDELRIRLNRTRQSAIKFYQNEIFSTLTEIDQKLPPLLEPVFQSLGFKYNPSVAETMEFIQKHLESEQPMAP